jgi:nucleoside 2-deoxyribosyltransferase
MSKQSQRLSVFVVMPFADEFRDTYELGIKPACVQAGAGCGRVDEQLFLENILERIYGQIEKADVIVAEMTGRNPNVFYEVGYAHGLGKPVILLTSTSADIPFDLMHYPHVVYAGQIRLLKAELETVLSKTAFRQSRFGQAANGRSLSPLSE